jgi:iron complex outermembrane receptor protein
MRLSTVALSVAALALLAATAYAQQDQDAVVVTATRFPERRLDAPVGMTIITAADIARDTARTLPEVLTHLGGLYARNNSGSPDLQLDLRGFGITGDQNTLVLLDGVRLNENDLSSTKLSAIPLQSIARIEILRGSGSVLYGGGAAGGTINIITKGPRADTKEASLFAGAGSYGTLDARASANLAGERTGALVSASHFESDNYRANNRVRQDNVTGDVRFGGAGGTLALKFGADAQRLRLPGVRDQNQLASDPRGTDTPNDWSTRDGNFVTLLGSRRLGSVELAADLGYRDQLSTADFVSLFSYYEAKLRSLSFAPRLRWTSAGSIPTSLVLGVDLSRWDFDRAFAADPASISAPSSSTTASQDNSAFYAQASAQVAAPLKLTLGWRTQRVSTRLAQAGFFASDQQQTRSPHAGELGVQLALSERWTAFGRLGTSFRVATVDEDGFTASGQLLEPQTARERDAGLEYRDARLRLRASAYEIDLDNEIYFSPIVVPFGANTNLSPTRRAGFELFGEARVAPSVELSGSLVLQSAKFKTGVYGGVDVSGKDVPLVPRALAELQAAWRLAPRTQLVASARYVGRQRYDNDQANAFPGLMPDYALADVKLSHSVAGWRLSASIDNIFDKHYYSYGIVGSFGCATPVCAYPQAGRTWFLSAEHALR